jgi:enoyl-CoA hydratase
VSLVRLERREGVAIVTLDRPRANAFTPELVGELSQAMTDGEASGAVVLASASPGIFSAGWDLPYLLGQDRRGFDGFVSAYCDLVRKIFAFEQPVIVALSGHAIAGGLIVAAAADERLAAEGKGELGLSEVLLGVPVPACLLEIFRHAVGARTMERLASTGENLTVDRALEVGLIDRVVASGNLLEEAVARARSLSERPGKAYASTKRLCRAQALVRFDRARPDAAFTDFWFSSDAQGRIRALVEKLKRR